MHRKLLSLIGLFPLCLWGQSLDEELLRRRISSHLLISDYPSAVSEGKRAVEMFADSKLIHTLYLQALCANGQERDALTFWSQVPHSSPWDALDRKMLEMLAWGVLKNAEHSSQLSLRLNALLGGAFTHDAKAVPMLLDQLRSSNALLRSIAIKIAPSYGDAPLKEEMARLLHEERVWYVRLDVIAAVGQMRLYALKPVLQELIANPRTLCEEKQAAILALVSMYDQVSHDELFALVRSERAGLRQLAAQLIVHLELKHEAPLLLTLLRDASSDVRICALNALALLRIDQIAGHGVSALVRPELNHPAAEVAITAAYVLMINQDSKGADSLRRFMRSEDPRSRRLASAAVSVGGVQALSLAAREFQETQDPYVKVNLAKGLIGQRVQVDLAAEAIHQVLRDHKQTLWMWEQEGNPLFTSLGPSRVKHVDYVAQYPVVIDQLVRLDLLSLLSIVCYPKAQDAVKEFLEQRSWVITGSAAAMLLQEGDEEGLVAVKAVLSDPDQKVRAQAALILAMVGKDPSATPVLQEAYHHVDREMKVRILEALSHIGDPRSIPFLLSILQEPFQLLRVVAASALIQCLYH